MADDAQRVDKWLFHARIVKTRTLAQKLVAGGHVRVNRDKVHDPARQVKIGDTLTVRRERDVIVCRIEAIATRRGPYAEARMLYCDPGETSR